MDPFNIIYPACRLCRLGLFLVKSLGRDAGDKNSKKMPSVALSPGGGVLGWKTEDLKMMCQVLGLHGIERVIVTTLAP